MGEIVEMSVVEKLEEAIENVGTVLTEKGFTQEFKDETFQKLLREFVAFKKAELQRKASIVFKIRKMIDDLWKEYCVGQKCQGLLNCKICLECEIGSQKTAYKGVLEILDKPPMEACVIVPQNKLEELMERFPKYRRSGICSREIGEFKDWFEKLKRVLGVEK